jgi:hypothetical protein
VKISIKSHEAKRQLIAGLQNDRLPFWRLWRELADFFLPKRYVWLQSSKERRVRDARNPFILDNTGTQAARVLAAGMMNGITSPARPWFNLRIPGFLDDPTSAIRLWLDEVTRRMLLVLGASNFYNSMAVLYLDLVVFGTGAMLIYEDQSNIIRCYNPALGEYYLGQDSRLSVNCFAREFSYTVRQTVEQWGIENVSQATKSQWNAGGANLMNEVKITHLIQPNDGSEKGSKSTALPYYECYWETGAPAGEVLAETGFNELPGIFPRWELTANDSYGTSPAMDALGDVIQLQQETKRKAQGLDKVVNPPIIADIQLQHKPTALLPNGITYVAGANNIGAKPLYQIAPPLGEMTADIRDVQTRIRETFHNPLFNMISQLDTVRSATEIDARREEKLVLLGSVLERFENEALDPALTRVFHIMFRAGLLPEPPEELDGSEIEIEYVSILSTAQRAVAAIPTERFVGLIGNIAAAVPSALNIPNWDELLLNYGEAIGVQARDLNSRAQIAAAKQAQAEQLAAQEAAVQGEVLVQGAKTLSETDVGGGANALQRLLG